MNPTLWREIEVVFMAALELPESEREQYVIAACNGRPQVRAEVEALLAAHAGAGNFLAVDRGATAGSWVGRRIGPYRLVEEIGRGGMGIVFHAQREDQFRQRVAIKIISSGSIDPNAMRRFLEERQILANLQHPHIAGLLDGGVTEEGLPYMVMEYIAGRSITAYCKENSLGTRARLEIFQTVCEAVHFAHQRLVVHRDIKPGNILVTPEGTPTLLDFGIAKILDPLTAAAAATRAPLQPLTPEYASPEHLRGETVTAATDVYSLGVLLFELLTGDRPYQLANTTLAEAIRMVSGGEPPRPSARAGDPAVELSEDLDWIAMKAIRKEPRERYSSARELAQDVGRYLAGLPVLARTRSPGIRRKMAEAARLSHWSWASSAIAIAALAAGGLFWSRHRAPPPAGSVQITRLAVLPFLNLSEDKNDEYLCDGLTEQLIDALSRIDGLRVVARTSAFQFKNRAQDIRQVGRLLNVNRVMEGSVRKMGTHLRVTAQLNDAEKGFHLWSRTYDREVKDVIAVQEDIAQAIATTVRIHTPALDDASMALRYPRSSEGYDLYLQGLYAYDRNTEEGLERSLGFFERAIDLDQHYPPAIYALAASYVALSIYGMWSPERSIPQARMAARRALELDKSMAEPHATLGYVAAVYDWNWPEAQREFQKAVELNPGCVHCHAWYAIYYLAPMQRFEEARAEVEKALAVDPLSGFFQAYRIGIAYFTRHYDLAIEEGRRALALNDANFLTHLFLGAALRQSGMLGQALAEEKKVAAMTANNPLALRNLGEIYAAMGNREETERVLGLLKLRAKGSYVNPSTFAMIYGSLGDEEQAMRWLEQAAAERDPTLVFLRSVSLFDRFQSNPRFQAVFQQIGLPAYRR